jgi:protein-tyrosine phosphatase
MDQMTFSGVSCCDKFRANPFAKSGAIARKCMDCGYDIQEHSAAAVTEKDVRKVLESVENVPSLISGSEECGQAAINEKSLQDANVGLVINTAGGLEEMFPKFRPSPIYNRMGISTLHFEWEDSANTTFTASEIDQAIDCIKTTLESGKSVLVHCAQGRSRSGSVVVAYTSRSEGLTIDDALTRVQGKRAMAQPNDHFMALLRAMS